MRLAGRRQPPFFAGPVNGIAEPLWGFEATLMDGWMEAKGRRVV